jgi:hypothetical protein
MHAACQGENWTEPGWREPTLSDAGNSCRPTQSISIHLPLALSRKNLRRLATSCALPCMTLNLSSSFLARNFLRSFCMSHSTRPGPVMVLSAPAISTDDPSREFSQVFERDDEPWSTKDVCEATEPCSSSLRLGGVQPIPSTRHSTFRHDPFQSGPNSGGPASGSERSSGSSVSLHESAPNHGPHPVRSSHLRQ